MSIPRCSAVSILGLIIQESCTQRLQAVAGVVGGDTSTSVVCSSAGFVETSRSFVSSFSPLSRSIARVIRSSTCWSAASGVTGGPSFISKISSDMVTFSAAFAGAALRCFL